MPQTKSYYSRNAEGEFQSFTTDQLTMLLNEARYRRTAKHDSGLSYAEKELLTIVMTKSIHWAGSLGGYLPGRVDFRGSRLLILDGPKLMVPRRMAFPTFRSYLSQLLGPQSIYFCGWLKRAITSLQAGWPWGQGQLLAIAGAPDCGKSFLQQLITPLLGNRTSSPYTTMSGGDKFNADVWGAEHGLIGDQNHKTDNWSRRNFGSAIKNMVVEPQQYIRGMGKQAVTFSPFIRLSITMNDHPNALKVLPTLDGDVADKIMLLHARKVKFPWPCREFPDHHVYFDRLTAELPGFLYNLMNWTIPEEIRNQRYGVVSFKDPELSRALASLSDEAMLLELIDTYIFTAPYTDHFSGTAAELLKALDSAMQGKGANRLPKTIADCGILLATLAHQCPERVTQEKIRGNRHSYLILKS